MLGGAFHGLFTVVSWWTAGKKSESPTLGRLRKSDQLAGQQAAREWGSLKLNLPHPKAQFGSRSGFLAGIRFCATIAPTTWRGRRQYKEQWVFGFLLTCGNMALLAKTRLRVSPSIIVICFIHLIPSRVRRVYTFRTLNIRSITNPDLHSSRTVMARIFE